MRHLKFHVHQAKFGTVNATWTRTRFPYPHHRIYYVTEGEGEIVLKQQTIQLVPGCMYLLPAYQLVKATCWDRMTHYYVHFQVESDVTNPLMQWAQPQLSICVQDDEVRPWFERLKQSFHSTTVDGYLHCQASLMMLLAPFFKDITLQETNRSRFQTVLHYIEEHVGKKISLDELANVMHLDPVYFSNLFTRTFHIPPSQFVVQKRVERAQQLLAFTNHTMKQIAEQCGFDNQMYFARVFQLRTGLTPTKYRQVVRI
jgi:AraC-like DNA-binding protein